MALINEPDFAQPRDNRRRKSMAKPTLSTRPAEVKRCPNKHPAWFLYYKKAHPNESDTIICCRKCEEESGADV
jgi:hypothetical protein